MKMLIILSHFHFLTQKSPGGNIAVIIAKLSPKPSPSWAEIVLISSNTPTPHPPGQVEKTLNTSLAAPGALAHHLIKLVKHSWQHNLSKS